MIGHGVKVIPQDDGSDTDSESGDNDSETENEDDDKDESNFDDDDWWEDMDPSDIIIEDDGNLYRIIKVDLEKNLGTGDVRHNGVVYLKNKIQLYEDANEMYVECGYILRRDGSDETTLYLVNGRLFEECEEQDSENEDDIENWGDGKYYKRFY